jgi:ATP-dependent RNA helicase DDX54/DBP10
MLCSIIATPGRFLHLQVEMELDLKSIEYIVFDEADRLFEMGFASQLTEILHALPANRQTLLFSATLPKALTEFAKAGLQEPTLVRLDADTKISQDLQSAFFSVSTSEKEGALIHLLKDVIKVPMGETGKTTIHEGDREPKGKKRKWSSADSKPSHNSPSSHSTIIFAATKHHVEYLARLISRSGYPVSYVYGTLDQVARRQQVARFRSGETQILVVTDVAARGIDIPILANVINYDFPPQPKIFIHRVGRTARAGRRGWSYSLVRAEDAPYLIDLQLFLARKLVSGKEGDSQSRKDFDFASDVIIGSLRRDEVERCVEAVNKVLSEDSELSALKDVSVRGEKQYTRSRPSASKESVKRAKDLVPSKGWATVNPLFADNVNSQEAERAKMLERVMNFRPSETIFEIGQRGLNRSEAANVMRKRREKIRITTPARTATNTAAGSDSDSDSASEAEDEQGADSEIDMAAASDSELAATFSAPPRRKKSRSNPKKAFEDTDFYMSYNPTTSLAEDRGYSVTGGGSTGFTEAARTATMDLTNDDSGKGFAEAHKARGVRWDKKSKKYVSRANDEDGSKGAKMIVGESGQKIAASFKSGRFNAWKKAHKIRRLPRTGELEAVASGGGGGGSATAPMGGRRGGKMWHKTTAAPKRPDKLRDDYKVRKKRYDEAKEKGLVKSALPRSELKGLDNIVKGRRSKEKKREKNARPSKKRRF